MSEQKEETNTAPTTTDYKDPEEDAKYEKQVSFI